MGTLFDIKKTHFSIKFYDSLHEKNKAIGKQSVWKVPILQCFFEKYLNYALLRTIPGSLYYVVMATRIRNKLNNDMVKIELWQRHELCPNFNSVMKMKKKNLHKKVPFWQIKKFTSLENDACHIKSVIRWHRHKTGIFTKHVQALDTFEKLYTVSQYKQKKTQDEERKNS
jgi:hypothetical protein